MFANVGYVAGQSGLSTSRGKVELDKVINQPSLHTPLHSVLVPISVLLALTTVFHSINSPDNSPLPHSVLLVLSLPYWSFQQYISL